MEGEIMEYSAQRQSGSVVVYVIVGILLSVMAVGAIIVAQNRGSQQSIGRPISEAPQGQTSSDSKSKEQTAKDTTSTEDQAAKDKAQAEAKKQAEEKLAADKKAADEKASAEQQAAAQEATNGPMARTGGAQAAALPTTGPEEDLLGMLVGVMAITGAGYFYYHFGRRK